MLCLMFYDVISVRFCCMLCEWLCVLMWFLYSMILYRSSRISVISSFV